jgi:hypothetical protein
MDLVPVRTKFQRLPEGGERCFHISLIGFGNSEQRVSFGIVTARADGRGCVMQCVRGVAEGVVQFSSEKMD